MTVTRDGQPAADAYVYAVPISGVTAPPVGLRADADGTAWFHLRDPGRYRFMVRRGEEWRSVDVDAPLEPLDLSKGGLGPVRRVELKL